MKMVFFSIGLMLQLAIGPVYGKEYTLNTDDVDACTKTHYYEYGDIFKINADGKVSLNQCPLTFVESAAWKEDGESQPCYSLCIKIINYSMKSCQVKMAYHDGLNDLKPASFDCHTFPPVLWCSSKNDIKIAISELKNYSPNEGYEIELKVTPFCENLDPTTTEMSISYHRTPRDPMSQSALIAGSVVGSVSILFVLVVFLFFYLRRRNQRQNQMNQRTNQNRPANASQRYQSVDHNPSSSQSGSDRAPPYREPDRVDNKPSVGLERNFYTPYQPVDKVPPPGYSRQERGPGSYPVGQERAPIPYYSETDRRPPFIADRWTPLSPVGVVMPPDPYAYQRSQGVPSVPPPPQYVQGSLMRYPCGPQDSEPFTRDVEPRFKFYNFDYSGPLERSNSASKNLPGSYRISPSKDPSQQHLIDGRSVLPKDRVKVHESEEFTNGDSSSDVDTTEDETTDDQTQSPYHHVNPFPPFMYNQRVPRPPEGHCYDPNIGHYQGPNKNSKEESIGLGRHNIGPTSNQEEDIEENEEILGHETRLPSVILAPYDGSNPRLNETDRPRSPEPPPYEKYLV
ncbi:hypothetical protein CHS0354_021692 [Potamilus streckersoni]|uniref:Uncharacterized protein n=1 Tax=Potamilus streckersoni TaxID=2493646 RepID=A0AAE0TL90_9BIVA|nr:hypothetical protein CHS0354_021692 [Potamilus streckersoni]